MSALTPARREKLSHPTGVSAFGWFTVGWNVVEGIVAIVAGLVAGSGCLIGFGADSFSEVVAASALAWRVRRAGVNAIAEDA